jgi:hypothetical protein
MSEIVKVIEFVKANTKSPSVSLARLSMMVGEDVKKVSSSTPYDNEKLAKYVGAANKITGKSIT